MLRAFFHVVHAAGFSFAGLKYLIRSELAARIELFAGAAALVWFLILGRSIGEIVVLLIIFCILMSVEALNTAIEEIVDHLSPEISEFARVTKDLGSTGVFFMLLAGGLYVAAVTADAAGLIAF